MRQKIILEVHLVPQLNLTPCPTMAAAQKTPMMVVVGVDDSEHSYYAIQWVFRNVLSVPGSFKLAIVHAQPSPAYAVGLSGTGTPSLFIHCLLFGISCYWGAIDFIVEEESWILWRREC